MTAKMGRPTDDPKDYQYRVRLSETDSEKLEYCARITERSKADIIREGIDKVYQEIKGDVDKAYQAIKK